MIPPEELQEINREEISEKHDHDPIAEDRPFAEVNQKELELSVKTIGNRKVWYFAQIEEDSGKVIYYGQIVGTPKNDPDSRQKYEHDDTHETLIDAVEEALRLTGYKGDIDAEKHRITSQMLADAVVKLYPEPDCKEGFDSWWCNEGSGMQSAICEDMEEFMNRVTRLAWENGFYKGKEQS